MFEQPRDPRNQAMQYLQTIQQQINQGGRVDSENEQLRSIMNRLTFNQISADEAMRLVNDVMNGRQDYNT